MPAFPALTPAARTWTPGEYPNAASVGINGRQVNVRISNVVKDSELQLQFVALTQTELNTLIQHYLGQQGSFEPFGLVAENWIGVSNSNSYTLSGYLWHYVEPPKVQDYAADNQTRFNVSLKLVAIPVAGMSLVGAYLRAKLTLTAGVAAVSNNGNAAGATFAVPASLAPGTASAAFVGFSKTVTVNWTPGFALVNGGFAGLTQTIQVSFAPGTASNGSVSASDYWSDFVMQLYEPNLYIDWWGL